VGCPLEGNARGEAGVSCSGIGNALGKREKGCSGVRYALGRRDALVFVILWLIRIDLGEGNALGNAQRVENKAWNQCFVLVLLFRDPHF
jgi:hypothetical protein